MLYVYSPSGPSWPVLGKLRFLRKLMTCTNVVMWEYFVLISLHLYVTEFTIPRHFSLLYLAGLNTFYCPIFCIEVPTGFSCGSLRTEWMPSLVPNEIILLKLSRLSSVVTYARSQKPKNDVLILYRRTTPQKLTNIKFNKERVSWIFSVSLFPLTFKLIIVSAVALH